MYRFMIALVALLGACQPDSQPELATTADELGVQ